MIEYFAAALIVGAMALIVTAVAWYDSQESTIEHPCLICGYIYKSLAGAESCEADHMLEDYYGAELPEDTNEGSSPDELPRSDRHRNCSDHNQP